MMAVDEPPVSDVPPQTELPRSQHSTLGESFVKEAASPTHKAPPPLTSVKGSTSHPPRPPILTRVDLPPPPLPPCIKHSMIAAKSNLDDDKPKKYRPATVEEAVSGSFLKHNTPNPEETEVDLAFSHIMICRGTNRPIKESDDETDQDEDELDLDFLTSCCPPPQPPLPPSVGDSCVRPKDKYLRNLDVVLPGPSTSSNTVNDINAVHQSNDPVKDFETLVAARADVQFILNQIRELVPDFSVLRDYYQDLDDLSLEELRELFRRLGTIYSFFLRDPILSRGLQLEEGIGVQEPSFSRGIAVKTDCQICFDNVNLYTRICCSFPACDSCMCQYIASSVSQGIVNIQCIGEHCTAFIYRDEILARLDIEMKEKYYRFLVDANKDPNVKTCPRCSNIHTVSLIDRKRQTKYGFLVKCAECSLDWCFECQAPWHPEVRCKDYKKGDKLVKSWAKEQHYGSNNAQRCPKCKIFIERKGGCDHMTCSKCDTSFCYKCGGRYLDLKFFGNHLSRYSPVGCKFNYRADQPVLRRFVRGSVLGAKLLGGLALVGLGVAAVAFLIGTSVIILPALGGYKYHKHRKIKRHMKHSREMMRARNRNAMLELHRQDYVVRRPQEVMAFYPETHIVNNTVPRPPQSEPVRIGIQMGHSQQVDVTVHNPHQPDTLASNDTKTSEIEMDFLDDHGSVIVTTAEIIQHDNLDDKSEADVVLHVKTSYSKSGTENKDVDKTKDGSLSNDCNGESAVKEKSEDTSAECGVANGEPAPADFESSSENTQNSSKPVQEHRRALSAGSVRKSGKKQEFGSISRKWRLKNNSIKQNGVDSKPVNVDPSTAERLHNAEQNSTDFDEDTGNDVLTQSGCFIKLFGKKLNSLQVPSEKEKAVQSKSVGGITNCPDVVSCALEAEMKRKDDLEKESLEVKDRGVRVTEKDECQGHLSIDNCSTFL